MGSKGPLMYALGCVTGGSLSYVATSWWLQQQKPPAGKTIPVKREESVGILGKYGLPQEEHLFVVEETFATSDNWRTRCPNWVVEHLTPQGLQIKADNATREKSAFKAVSDVPEAFRAGLLDYREARQHGDYVRGHMVPAADMKHDQGAMDATFYLNHNVVPQDGKNNSSAWLHLETLVRKVAKKHPHTWVLTGPAWQAATPEAATPENPRQCAEVRYRVVGPHKVAVPTHLWKVVVSETTKGNHIMGAFLVPNIPCDEPPAAYQVDTATVEALTGYEMFPHLNRRGAKDLCSVEKCTEKAKTYFDKPGSGEADTSA